MDSKTQAVLTQLADTVPEVLPITRLVGSWLWIEFDRKPSVEVRARLKELKFFWNRKREAWQCRCGHEKRGQGKDPKWKYGAVAVATLDN